MNSVIQQLVSGIAMGFIYCMVATEYTLIYNTSSLMNFGHDKYIMCGAYIFAGTFMIALGANSVLAVVGTLVLMAGLGVLVAIIGFNPLKRIPTIHAVTCTLALSMIVREGVRLTYGAAAFTVNGFLRGTFTFGGITIPKTYVVIIVLAIILLILQQLLMKKTMLGTAMLAVSQDKEASSLMGINVGMILVITTAISLCICGLIGILIIPLYGCNMAMTATLGTKGFVAGIIGGLGNLNGAIAGGLCLGLVEVLFLILGGPGIYKDFVSFVVIIAFLLFRPQGILRNQS